MAKKKKEAANVKPEVPLDVQQSIRPSVEPEPESKEAEETQTAED